MNDYANFPPFQLFISILNHSPLSAFLYATLWEQAKEKNCAHVLVKKKDTKREYYISPTRFKNQLFELTKWDAVKVRETNQFYEIRLNTNAKG